MLVFVALFTACTSNTPIPTPTTPKQYSVINTQGDYVAFVVVDRSIITNKEALWNISQEICRSRHPICQVLYWDDVYKAGVEIPMTDAQVNAQVAHFERNENTDYVKLWLCSEGDCK